VFVYDVEGVKCTYICESLSARGLGERVLSVRYSLPLRVSGIYHYYCTQRYIILSEYRVPLYDIFAHRYCTLRRVKTTVDSLD